MGVSRDSPILMGTPVISGTAKATDVKFGRYIYRVLPSKSPLKISGKGTVVMSRDFPILGGTPYYLRNG